MTPDMEAQREEQTRERLRLDAEARREAQRRLAAVDRRYRQYTSGAKP